MSEQRTDPRKGTILIVDDNVANLHLMAQMLTKHGYKVRPVNSGAPALAAIQANPPDLILLDIMMPEMSGYEVCKRLKANEQTREIPVIFVSVLNTAEDKVEAFAAGGVDYVTKPFQAEEVVARVETHLTLRNLQKNLQQEVAELDAFAHTVAHDLKSPLTTIAGYAGLLTEFVENRDAMSQETARLTAHGIAQGVEQMNNIIDGLLLLAGVRHQKVEFKPLDTTTIVDRVKQRLDGLIQKYQARIIVPETWATALGYDPWVEEIWANYISNAIKYGGRPPHVQLGSTDQDDGDVRFWVRDDGPGLSPEYQARLFIPFERMGRVRVKGYGLGLSIVVRIAERLGGQVGVESELGQGSVFWFTLPGG
jgi:signal transduction histidine kinase